MRPVLTRWSEVLAVEAHVAGGGLDPWEARALAVAERAGRCGLLAWGGQGWAREVLAEARHEVLARLAVGLLEEGHFGGQLLREPLEAGGERLTWPLPDGAALVADALPPLEGLRPSRVRALRWRPARGEEVALTHPLSLLVRAEASRGGPVRAGASRSGRGEGQAPVPLAAALCSSVANTCLALGTAFVRRHRLQRDGADTLDGWEATWAREDARRRALERTQLKGAPRDAVAKVRQGLTAAESLRYAPELSEAPVRLHLLALRREVARQGGEDAGALLERLWPEEVRRARGELARRGLSAADYHLLPVHPWQHRRRVGALFGDLLESRALVALPPRLRAWAQADLATVEPVVGDVSPLHLRLALDAGTARGACTLTPPSIHELPGLGAWLGGVVERALTGPLAACRPSLARERASLGLDAARVRDGAARAAQLGVLLRDNPTLLPRPSGVRRRLWPALALPSCAPFSTRTLAGELVHVLADRRGLPVAEAARLFFSRMCALVLQPTVALLGLRGVALPADAARCWVDFDADGLPVHLTLRDVGALRLCRARLSPADLQGLPASHSAEVGSPEELAALVARAVVHGHLADLLEALAADVPELLAGGERRLREALEESAAVLPAREAARLTEALWRRPVRAGAAVR